MTSRRGREARGQRKEDIKKRGEGGERWRRKAVPHWAWLPISCDGAAGALGQASLYQKRRRQEGRAFPEAVLAAGILRCPVKDVPLRLPCQGPSLTRTLTAAAALWGLRWGWAWLHQQHRPFWGKCSNRVASTVAARPCTHWLPLGQVSLTGPVS